MLGRLLCVGGYTRGCGVAYASFRRLEQQKQKVLRKFHETKSQLEEDTDKEIEELRAKHDHKLAVEREATLRLQGENGIMRKKFSALKKDIEDQQVRQLPRSTYCARR